LKKNDRQFSLENSRIMTQKGFWKKNVLWLVLHEFLIIIIICVSWKYLGCSLIPEPPAKQTSRHTSCLAICRPFEPNVKLFCQNFDLRWKFPTLPLEGRTEKSSERSSLYLRLQVWVKRKDKKRGKNQSIKDWRKAREKKRKKNESIKDWRKAKEKKRKRKILWTKQCLNVVKNCQMGNPTS